MVALGSLPGVAQPRSTQRLVIDVSDEEDNDLKERPIENGNNEGVAPIEEEDDGNDDSSDGSLYSDMIDAVEEAGFETDETDVCTEEEGLAYRKRLREIGLDAFIQETVSVGKITAKKLCTAFGVRLPALMKEFPDHTYYRVLGKAILRELRTRQKLPQYNTFDDAVELLRKSKSIIVITGAGISTNLGIPDFRSKTTGFYAKMREAGFESGEEIFDMETFKEDPSVFYKYGSETFPTGGLYSPTHGFIRLLQDKKKLLTNYTQNIDNVEGVVGIASDKLMQCHGSWATASCIECKHKVQISAIEPAIRARTVPKCPACITRLSQRPLKRKRTSDFSTKSNKSRHNAFDDDDDDDSSFDILEPGVMKPDITFFGEALPPNFFDRIRNRDLNIVDLVIVIGTSMQVAPVSEIPRALPEHVPQIYLSRDPCPHINFDITLLGDCDVVVAELAKRVGWEFKHSMLPEDRKVEIKAYEEGKDWIWQVKPLT